MSGLVSCHWLLLVATVASEIYCNYASRYLLILYDFQILKETKDWVSQWSEHDVWWESLWWLAFKRWLVWTSQLKCAGWSRQCVHGGAWLVFLVLWSGRWSVWKGPRMEVVNPLCPWGSSGRQSYPATPHLDFHSLKKLFLIISLIMHALSFILFASLVFELSISM